MASQYDARSLLERLGILHPIKVDGGHFEAADVIYH
jgi:hypothetical protein